VYDNNSSDNTAAVARAAGAEVRREKRQGKGFVVSSMFEQIDADVYLMVDGDDTYDATYAKTLVDVIERGEADMVVAARLTDFHENAFRDFHRFGNRMLARAINLIFGSRLTDIFSGYRGFSHKTAKTLPITSQGFDVETEMTVQALRRNLVIKEIQAPYGSRPEGSFSKLQTFRDGFRVVLRLFLLLKMCKPMTFFGSFAILFFVSGLIVGITPLYEFATTNYVYSVQKALMAMVLMIISFAFSFLGIELHTINFRILELENIISKLIRN
jgi:glycosyltransferase involved in cell wall biosynthesis